VDLGLGGKGEKGESTLGSNTRGRGGERINLGKKKKREEKKRFLVNISTSEKRGGHSFVNDPSYAKGRKKGGGRGETKLRHARKNVGVGAIASSSLIHQKEKKERRDV